jgi:hypothetical protein
MNRNLRIAAIACVMQFAAGAVSAADHIDLTWMSITNMQLDFTTTRVVVDGYITRLPQDLFSGGGGGLAHTSRAMRPDEAAVRQVFDALGGRAAVSLLITGHNHFDHTFDTPVWAKLSGAPVIGAPTTCLQLEAARIPKARCTAVMGGERIKIAKGVTMFVIRWNHSGSSASNPEQHDAVELKAAPVPDARGGLRAGVAEDFPNGGGNRAYLFVVDAPDGPLSLFFQDSAGAADLGEPIVVDGKDYGAPLDNLRRALQEAGLARVDLWIGTGGADVAKLVLPVLKPAAYLPVHWDGLYGAFLSGPPMPYADAPLEKLLADSGVTLVRPVNYMDKWRLDRSGVHELDNGAVKRKLGFH